MATQTRHDAAQSERWHVWAERAAIMEMDGSVARHWAEPLAWIAVMTPPAGHWAARWARMRQRALVFADRFAPACDGVGWTPPRVLGVRAFGDAIAAGALIWRFDRARVIALLDDGTLELEGPGVGFRLRCPEP
jgi:hypothetical protein